ncbi:MAG: hypothetical protein ISP01_01320 [Methanobrevibacter arboriphilus]|uniref:Uncharacterized protein n=1 Tax=Methanobrevibacter arboriphilus TaxID=39441 RepID=A0A843AAX1_METAZ|nr:hypothetical protein [Methanobrevibacter arboriphilus]MBF4468022.1 hypothetical protein [Methanobrevibacter arboriphilus]
MVIIIQKNANTSKLKPTPKTQNTWHNQYTNPQQQQKPTKKIAKKTTQTQTQTNEKQNFIIEFPNSKLPYIKFFILNSL